MRIQSHSLPLREEEGEAAGDGVGGAGEEVSYHIIFHKHEVRIGAWREIHNGK